MGAARGEPVIFPCRVWVEEDGPDTKRGVRIAPGERITPEEEGARRNRQGNGLSSR